MADLPLSSPRPEAGLRLRFMRLAGSRGFQAWAARMPVLRHFVRAEGAALFDIVAGFVNSQSLVALVELRILHLLHDGAQTAAELAWRCDVPEPRMQVLLQAGAALGLLRRQKDGRFSMALRGAAMLGVPGLEAMVRHHRALYADLADPVNFWRDGQNTELARFWPYVFGASGAVDPDITASYSRLMADSQTLVAEDTLRMADLRGVRDLLDIGGGTGAFLCAAGMAFPALHLSLFDLPGVVTGASARLNAAGLASRSSIYAGSFRDDPLPQGADAVSLIRVLYDHDDSTVLRLLTSVHAALPPGGRIIISEPMSGGAIPDRATDVYFAIYTLAMQTGRTRTPTEIGAMLAASGFENIEKTWGYRPFITSVVTARRV